MKRTKQKTNVHIALVNGYSAGGLRAILPEMALSAILAVVCVSLLLRMFDLPCYEWLIYIFVILCPAGLTFLSQRLSGRTLALYLLFAAAAACALFYSQLWSGCLAVANQVFITANHLQDLTFVLFETGVPQEQEVLYGTLALLFIMPAENLRPDTIYTLAVDNTLISKNGDRIDDAYTIVFKTGTQISDKENPLLAGLGIDILSFSADLPMNENSVPGSSPTSSALNRPPGNNRLSLNNINAELLSRIVLITAAAALVLVTLLRLRKVSIKK